MARPMLRSPRATARPTAIDAIAEDWVTTLIDLESRCRDLDRHRGSPRRVRRPLARGPREAHRRHARRSSTGCTAPTSVGRRRPGDARPTCSTSSQLSVESYEAKLHLRDLNVLASPGAGDPRDLRPHAARDDRRRLVDIAEKPRQRAAAPSTATSRRCGRASRRASCRPRRQVARSSEQARKHADPLGFFFDFTGAAKLEDGSAIPGSLKQPTSRKGAEASADAYGAARRLPRDRARARGDRGGRRSAASSTRCTRAHFLGAEIDLDETYEWGIEELERMVDEQTRIASEIKPGASRATRRSSSSTQDDSRKLERHRRTPGLDAGAQRQGRRRALDEPLRHPGPDQEARVHDRARRKRAASTTRAPATTSRAPAGCGGACPRASPSSTPGARPRRCTTRAFPGITCSSARPCTTARSSTPGAATSPARAATPRAGRSTPSG